MKRPLTTATFFILSLTFSLAARAKPVKVNPVEPHAIQSKVPIQKSWQNHNTSVVKARGLVGKKKVSCGRFNVTLGQTLSIDIACGDLVHTKQFQLKSSERHSVTQYGGQVTITLFDFLEKKPQTSRLKQSILKIPFVSEVLHIKRNPDQSLAFYYETFALDQFGRIVQTSLLEAHGLQQPKVQASLEQKKISPKAN